jgi:thiol:disulfide interchange protein DsbA
MTLARRDFSLGLVAAGLGGAGLSLPSLAQSGWPAEGTHYVRLQQPAAVAAAGKLEVVEFFWYECPHCNAFEPALEAWSKKLPADVVLRRVPVWFQEVPFASQQRLFYTLEVLGSPRPCIARCSPPSTTTGRACAPPRTWRRSR